MLISFARIAYRAAGLLALTLGLLFWSGHGHTWLHLHMAAGVTVMLVLWLLAVLALRQRVGGPLPWLALGWGLLLPVLGWGQLFWLPGDWHVLLRLLHLALGMGAMGLCEQLARRMQGLGLSRRIEAA